MSENGVAVTVRDVSRRFRRTVAIDHVSLEVKPGELFGVLGPDGAGKTTLLRMMAGVLDPSGPPATDLRGKALAILKPPTGHINVDGFDTVAEAEALKTHIGYMPQSFGLYHDLSVDENLAFVAEVFGITGKVRAKRIDELLAFTNLAQFRTRRAGQLSGGMKKKLALACALLHHPALLLLDEPTTGVDPVTRRDFWDLLSGLHAEGVTVIVSTPYMDEAERCNRAAMLFEGRLLALGTPDEIKARTPGQALALQGDDMRAARTALEGIAGLLEIQTYGDQLNLIFEGDLKVMLRTVRDALERAGVMIDSLEPAPVRMEETFIYLVNEARGHKEART